MTDADQGGVDELSRVRIRPIKSRKRPRHSHRHKSHRRRKSSKAGKRNDTVIQIHVDPQGNVHADGDSHTMATTTANSGSQPNVPLHVGLRPCTGPSHDTCATGSSCAAPLSPLQRMAMMQNDNENGDMIKMSYAPPAIDGFNGRKEHQHQCGTERDTAKLQLNEIMAACEHLIHKAKDVQNIVIELYQCNGNLQGINSTQLNKLKNGILCWGHLLERMGSRYTNDMSCNPLLGELDNRGC